MSVSRIILFCLPRSIAIPSSTRLKQGSASFDLRLLCVGIHVYQTDTQEKGGS